MSAVLVKGDHGFGELFGVCVSYRQFHPDVTLTVMIETLEASRLAGSCIDISEEVLDNGPWDDELCDPDTTVVGGVYLPIGPWAEGELTDSKFIISRLIDALGSNPEETQMLKYAGILMRQNFLASHRGYHPMLLKQGIDHETLEDWSKHVQQGGKRSFLQSSITSHIHLREYRARARNA